MKTSAEWLATLRALPVNARREAVNGIMLEGDPEAKRMAALVAKELPAVDDAPENKKQTPLMTK